MPPHRKCAAALHLFVLYGNSVKKHSRRTFILKGTAAVLLCLNKNLLLKNALLAHRSRIFQPVVSITAKKQKPGSDRKGTAPGFKFGGDGGNRSYASFAAARPFALCVPFAAQKMDYAVSITTKKAKTRK